MGSEAFFVTAAGVIPLLLLVLATEERLGLVKQEWRRSGRLHLVAVLLGALVVAEAVALAAVKRGSSSTFLVDYITITIAFALALVAWGIGWSIWAKYPADMPEAGTLQKRAFYAIGLVTVLMLCVTTWWALS